MNIKNNYSFAENQADSLLNQDMNPTEALLTQDELSAVGGGVLCWLGFGYGLGYLIDQQFIKPLWK